MGFILNAYKPKDTKNMIIVYSICFWIVLMAFSIAIVNPYDEDSVEYMLKEKVISKMKEIVGENPDDGIKMPDGSIKMPDGSIKMPDGTIKMPDGSFKMPDGSFKMPDGSIKMPDGTIIPKKQTTSTIKVPPTTSVSEEQGFLSKTIKSFF